MIKGRNK